MLQSPNIGNSNQRVSFSDFHSSKQQQKTEISKIALLPLLEESINSPAMVRHCANVLIRITNYLNANQTTLVTADQPVYALGKQIQWRYPNEGNIFWMLGGLHIEMTFMSAIGNWLNGSGWVEVFEHGSRFTLARVESFLYGNKVKRCRYAHQVSLAIFLQLLQEVYLEECPEKLISCDEWLLQKCETSVNAFHWVKVISLQTTLFMFVRSLLEANFEMYISSLKAIIP